jgi:hypothetical protein
MSAVSQAQHALAVEDLRRLDAGEETRTGMSREHLEELVNTSNVHELPARAKAPKPAPTRRYVY